MKYKRGDILKIFIKYSKESFITISEVRYINKNDYGLFDIYSEIKHYQDDDWTLRFDEINSEDLIVELIGHRETPEEYLKNNHPEYLL